MEAKIFLLNSSTLVAWPLCFAGKRGGYESFARIMLVAPQERCFTACLEGRPKLWNATATQKDSGLPRIGSVTWYLHGLPVLADLFEFTPRKNTILNVGGAWFALMVLRIFVRTWSWVISSLSGSKRKLDQVFKVFREWASLLRMRFCGLSRDCRARASIGVREYLPALGLVKAVFVEAQGDHLRLRLSLNFQL